jgi:hypothetical protein
MHNDYVYGTLAHQRQHELRDEADREKVARLLRAQRGPRTAALLESLERRLFARIARPRPALRPRG